LTAVVVRAASKGSPRESKASSRADGSASKARSGRANRLAAGLFAEKTFASPEGALHFMTSVLESSTEYSMIATDPAGVIQLWNEGARRLYGYASTEILGRPWSVLHTEPVVESGVPQEMIAQALSEGKWEGMVEQLREDGSRFIARVVTTARRASDGSHDGFLLISNDVTKQVRLSEELERTHTYTRALLESAPDALVIVNADGFIQTANAETENMFGYDRAQLVGRPVDILIPERYKDDSLHPRGAFFHSPRARPMGAGLELSGRRQDGTEFPVEISFSPLETKEGMLATAAIRDVTERKRAEGKFRGLLDAAPDAMVIVDGEGKIQLANVETAKLFGYGQGELIGRQVEMLMPDRYHGRHPAHRGGFFEAPRARPMGAGLELWGRRKDGTEFPVEIFLSPLETEDGLLATAAIRDVTQRQRFERDLREANLELEAASRAKDRFLASMSHELRTPLNAILGFTGTLVMGLPGPLNAEQTKQLKTVQTNGKHLLSLINDLLDLARIESGKIELVIESIDGEALLQEVALGLRPLAEEKGLAIDVVADKGHTVESDRRALRQILINLANNAIKFTDEGRISLELHRTDATAQVTRFSVVDTGCGIKEADQKQLFAAFEQIGGSGTHPYAGTGLGLYICQTLAALMGAAITFESAFGQGSTFGLELVA
jgi:protein-histidine pros-kinase